MKFSLLIQILLVGSLLALTVPPNVVHVYAVPSYSAGVKSGDTVTYGNVTSSWPSNVTQSVVLNVTGSIFASPLISALASNFGKANSSIQVNYQATGSGRGVLSLTTRSVDFAASDLPLSPAQTSALPAAALHIPETVGAVVVAYNIPGLSTGLKLNTTTIAKIFLGQIINWNDTAIRQLNPGLTLPNQSITVVHRADGSGTTFVFTGYLSSAPGNIWTPGQGTVVNWPIGFGASGNQGEATVIQSTPDTIGYVELNNALSNNLKVSYLLNADRSNFVQPTLANVAFAVTNSSSVLPRGNESWASVSLLNAHGPSSYPIAYFSYLLVYKEQNVLPDMTLDKARALASFLSYTIHGGQQEAAPLNYVPLSANVVSINEATIRSMTYNGQILLNPSSAMNATLSVQPNAIIDFSRSIKQVTIAISLNNTPDVPPFNSAAVVLSYNPHVLTASNLDYSTNVFTTTTYPQVVVRNCLDGHSPNGMSNLCQADDGPGITSFAESILGGATSDGTAGNVFLLTFNVNTTSPSFSQIQIKQAILGYGSLLIPLATLDGYYTSLSCGGQVCPPPPPPPMQPPPFIAEFMHVQSIQTVVQSVSSGNIVTILQVITFNNGTSPRTFPLSANVANGSGNLAFWILSSGLTTGDHIYNIPSPTINRTDTESFLGAARQVIHLNLVQSGGAVHLSWAWDQTTGVLLSFDSHVFLSSGSNISFGYSFAALTSTSLWQSTPTSYFSISANPSTLIVSTAPNNNTVFVPVSTITLTSHNFTRPVQLTANVNPSGLSVGLGSPSLFLNLNSQNTTQLIPFPLFSTEGTFQVPVIGTAGALSEATIVTVIVTSSADFKLTANPASLTIHKAPFYDPFAFATSTITLTSLNGFSGNLLLQATAVAGYPSQVGLNFSQSLVSLAPNSSANSTLTVSAANAALGTYFVNVTASGLLNGTLSRPVHHSVTITVQVVAPPPDFQIFLSIPLGGNTVFAGGSTSVGIQLFSSSVTNFNGTVSLTGQVSPLVNNGPTLSFNPTQISFIPPATSFSQLTISTTTSTSPGNYTIAVKATSGTLVHTFQLQLTVLPPPVLTLSPSSGPVGTQVRVHGSGFLSPSQGRGFSPVELQITFDDQLVGLIFIQGGSFNFTFNVPDAQAGIVHQIHAKELFPSNLDVQASFLVLSEPGAITVGVSGGTIYFPGDTATIFVMTSFSGQPTTVSSLQVILVTPNGSNITLNAVLVSRGVYRASYAVPATGSIGTYAVLVKAHQAGSSDGSALVSFEVKPTWLQSNGRNVITATSLLGAVGTLGVVVLAWRKGYFTKRKDEFLTP